MGTQCLLHLIQASTVTKCEEHNNNYLAQHSTIIKAQFPLSNFIFFVFQGLFKPVSSSILSLIFSMQ